MAVIVAADGFAFLEGFHSMRFLQHPFQGVFTTLFDDGRGRLGEVSLPMVPRSGSSRGWFHTQAPSASSLLVRVLSFVRVLNNSNVDS